MRLNKLSSKTSRWLDSAAPLSDIVISSRIRLARNLAGHKFISRCSDSQKQRIVDIVKPELLCLEQISEPFFIDIDKASPVNRDLLVERQLISRNLASGSGPRGVVISADELFSAQINEEDHLRLCVLAPGLNLKKARQQIDEIDDCIGGRVGYAFSGRYGFLTACPTNVGTGIRVSVMLHLPALKMTEQLKKFFDAARAMNLAVRGLFGEGTEAVGDFFQVSNQVTLGVSESEITGTFTEKIIPKIVEYERLARERLLSSSPDVIEDKISRALAVLGSAKLISSHEAMFLLSSLRMGINVGRIKDISIDTVNRLFLLTQPAHLQINADKSLDPQQRDILRAGTLRSGLN